jgi:hypothetical protein
MLSIKQFRLLFRLFWFNRNTETLCFGIEANNRNKPFASDSAKTSFSSSFNFFKSKLVSKDTLPCGLAGKIAADCIEKNIILYT